jgi:hypothetical protein
MGLRKVLARSPPTVSAVKGTTEGEWHYSQDASQRDRFLRWFFAYFCGWLSLWS